MEFGRAFLTRYPSEKLTPYMHVFIAHVGDMLKEHRDIESFSNMDIEGKHARNKAWIGKGSAGFGGHYSAGNHLPTQQLLYESRNNPSDDFLDSGTLFIDPKQNESVSTKKRKIDGSSPQDKKKQKVSNTDSTNGEVTRKKVGRGNKKNKAENNWATRMVQKESNIQFAATHLLIMSQKYPGLDVNNNNNNQNYENITS